MTETIEGSASGYISDSLSEHLRLKLHAASFAYEVKNEKELAYTECKELEFLMVDLDSLPNMNKTSHMGEKNEVDHTETTKINFAAQQPKERKFMLDHAWRILKNHSKWDVPKPFDTKDHAEIFRRDVRPHNGVVSIVTSSSSSGTISIHLLSFAESSSATSAYTFSSNFCFLDLSDSSSSPALLELSTALSFTATESIPTKLFIQSIDLLKA
ncbi:hypothetical protein Tco_0287409 [Tanacetum coccineum]